MNSDSYIFPASFAQQRLWFLDQLDPGKSIYNMPFMVRLKTPLDLPALQKSLNEIVRRHESLRTTFTTVNGTPMQVIAKDAKLELPVTDLSQLPKEDHDDEIYRWGEAEGNRPFDLAGGPLFRLRLLRLAEAEHVLLVTMHHIISDGWSMGIFFRELATLYEALLVNSPAQLTEPSVQYADYSVWQREWLVGDVLERELSYWRNNLKGAPAALELAADRTRPAIQSFKGARRYIELPVSLTDRLRALSRREDVTLFMTLLAAFDILLWRYSANDDVVVGTPFAGRTRSELEGVIGYFANTLPLRVDLSGNPTFCELLRSVRKIALEAHDHQNTPFDRIVEELRPERSLSYTPLFQVIFAFENTPQSLEFPGLQMKWLEVDRGTARCDLSLFITDKGGALSCMWEYSTDLFDGETIERMISSYTSLLESILKEPHQKIGYFEMLSEAERRRVVEEWNAATTTEQCLVCMHELFEAQVANTPDALAVTCDDERMTYAQLNACANQLAHHLRKWGVGPEVLVGVCLERSATMITALLGVLKAGGAYVPIDPHYPSERVEFMLQDSGVAVLVTEQSFLDKAPKSGVRTICLDNWQELASENTSNPASNVNAENLAYVIYTSGSTGQPKGVEIMHRTATHLFAATRDQIGFRPGDVYTVVHSSAFDFSVWEIWGSLLQAGTLVVVPLAVAQAPLELFDLICREGVTVLNQTPSALRQLLAEKSRAQQDWNVNVIICGGDALDSELATELAQLDVPVWNFYGPTENTVWTTSNLINQGSNSLSTAPTTGTQLHGEVGTNSIGRALADVQTYLVDGNNQLVPVGVPGELLIGGAGLARAYLKRPELTAEKFVPDPFGKWPGSRLYRTGDIARWRRDGKLEFLGRSDHQIKLRGFRVELGEIETVLNQHEKVSEAVVMLREDRMRDQRLVAYVVPRETMPPATDLRQFLMQSLPDYMVPSAFVMLDAMPLTPNKKVDRLALPPPDYSASTSPAGAAPPEGPIEEILVAIWTTVLGTDGVGVHDNFFAAGGHSLLATQVMARVREAFQIELPLRTLFESPTIHELARRVERSIKTGQGIDSPRLIRVGRSSLLPLSFAQQRLWFLVQLEPRSAFYNISRGRRLRGSLNVAALERALNEIVQRHEALRTSFVEKDGAPFQKINDCENLQLIVTDLSSAADPELEARRLAAEECEHVFVLSEGPFLRPHLLRIAPDDHVLILTLHHIAADGWSLAILFRELTALYTLCVAEQVPSLPALPIQYADYAIWQRTWLQGEVLERLVGYWKKRLAAAPVVLNLPTDKARPAEQSFRGAIEDLSLPLELSVRLKEISRTEGATLFMTCLTAFYCLLSRWSGQEDLLVGTDVANRSRVETEGLIGFFTNLICLRAKVSGGLTFNEFLRQVRETTLEAYTHQDLPFEKLVEELRLPRDLRCNPLVQTLLVMQNQSDQDLEFPGVQVSRFELPIERSRFDLVLFLSESESGLHGMWLYNADLFEPETIACLSKVYHDLLKAVAHDPDATLSTYELSEFRKGRTPVEGPEHKLKERDVKASRLRSTRRRAVDLRQVNGVQTHHLTADSTLPLVIEPDGADIDLAVWGAANREFINQQLLQHGALLFRGFDVDSILAFETFAGALCDELFGEYGDLPREQQGGNVYASTPYPANETILFHNESSHMHRWPMYIWFYCVRAAEQGGESPIVDCRRVYQLMEPSIRDRFERLGLIYLRNFSDELDVSWQEFFHTTDRKEVERYCNAAGIEYEWKGDNGLRTRQRREAVAYHPQTGEKVFFNQVQLHHISCLSPQVRASLLSMMDEADLPRNVYYGDGSPIEDSVMAYLGDLYRQNCVTFPWQEHDIAMLNNMLVAHSRNPFSGERKIVVALGDLVTKNNK